MTDEITLKLPLAFVNQCLEALAERPIKDALRTFMLIQDQAKQQIAAQQQKAHDDAADRRDMPSGAPAP
jgi:hypothetical protein